MSARKQLASLPAFISDDNETNGHGYPRNIYRYRGTAHCNGIGSTDNHPAKINQSINPNSDVALSA